MARFKFVNITSVQCALLTNAERSQCTNNSKHDLWRSARNTQQPDKWLNSTLLCNPQLTVKVLVTKCHHAHTTCVNCTTAGNNSHEVELS